MMYAYWAVCCIRIFEGLWLRTIVVHDVAFNSTILIDYQFILVSMVLLFVIVLFCMLVKTIVLSTDIFTFLLYETSHSSIKLGYYHLRMVPGNYTVVVCDAITKKVEWSWHISHICGHHRIKSGVKIEVGRYVSSLFH